MKMKLACFLFLVGAVILSFAGPGCKSAGQYTGKLKDGLPHGEGTYLYPGGASYTGQFEEGLPHGQGTWTHPEKISYTGDWVKGLYHGQGVLTFYDGSMYSGGWTEGNMHGEGTYTWSDGRQYAGQWENSYMHGQGVMTYRDGSVYNGEWENGQRHGYGTLSDPAGITSTGLWENNVFQAVRVEGVTLDRNTLNLNAWGVSETLLAVVKPENATNKSIRWASSNATVASVYEGVVTPGSPGVATITVTTAQGGHMAFCNVTVNSATAVTGVTLNNATLTLYINGAPETLIATVAPDNATNKTLIWESSNHSIATVSPEGTVTPLSVGATTITVRTVDGSWTAECLVTVMEAEE